jgi:hypothetical protein
MFFGIATWIFFSILNINVTRGTTIMPFENLGSLLKHADAMVLAKVVRNFEQTEDNITWFRSRLSIIDPIKGDLEIGETLEITKWQRKINDVLISMWGDIELYEGSTYLLFLEKKSEGDYLPICFAYYIFEEISKGGVAYLVPSELSKEFHLSHTTGVEPLFVYPKADLISNLKKMHFENAVWKGEQIKGSMSIDDFYPERYQRQSPTHCTFLSASGKNFRWQNLADQPLDIRYTQGGDPSCSQSINSARGAINDLNMYYDGVAVTDAGTFVRSGDYCSLGSALGSNFLNWVNTTYGGSRNITVQFNDPCGEIGDLDSEGKGVLAIGGLYALGTHTYENEPWLTGAYGYVVLNNGVGSHYCQATKLKEIISHELTHSIGLGHISTTNGDANMNPSCCHSISGLDEACVDFAYAQEDILPMELLHFKGEAFSYVNTLSWATAWENDVDQYVVERASRYESLVFNPIFTVRSKGNTETGNTYSWIDKIPLGDAYYRLKSVDFSGEEDFSNIIHIKRPDLNDPLVYPNITRDRLYIQTNVDMVKNIEIVSITGQTMMLTQVEKPSASISVLDLPAGWYFLRLSTREFLSTFSFLKQD